MNIEMFVLLVAGHFIADYVFQTDSIAKGKNNNIDPCLFGVNWWYWMTAHAFTHGVVTYLITGNIYILIGEFILHWYIDFGKCQKWYGVHKDQFLHIVCKAMWSFA
jgi:hypothetical protein